jgi:hypothetical protein
VKKKAVTRSDTTVGVVDQQGSVSISIVDRASKARSKAASKAYMLKKTSGVVDKQGAVSVSIVDRAQRMKSFFFYFFSFFFL